MPSPPSTLTLPSLHSRPQHPPFEAFGFDATVNETWAQKEMDRAIQYHDTILDRRGPVSSGHRTHTRDGKVDKRE